MLHKSSILVKLTVHSWDGFKTDKRVSETVDQQFKTAGDAGNYNKRLLAKEILKPVTNVLNKVRSEHARLTHPWCYDGVSLLPGKLYFPYTSVMRDLKDHLTSNVDDVIAQLPVHIANQRHKLGDMFNIDDYPDPASFKHRFDFSFSFFPVPQADHFIIDSELAEAEKIKSDLTKQLAETQAAALKRLYDEVLGMVEHVHERLSDPANVFHKTMLTNLDQMVKVLPGLNIFNDENLDRACHEIKTRILTADAADLRKDQNARKEIADSAYDIAALLRSDSALKKAA